MISNDFTEFYGLSRNPFDVSPDSTFFFPSEGHREALAALQYGISERKGFVLILGEAGIGKTTLIDHLVSILDKKVRIVLFPQSHLPFEQMLKEMLLKFKLPVGPDTKGFMLHALYYHLIGCLKEGENVALIIDEAQNMSVGLMEEVRLLANLETDASKLLQIVLVGQPELGEKLRTEAIRQLKQRIAVSYRINPLTLKESPQYIEHRLKIAGSGSYAIFTDKALSLICRHARGNPLSLNILCHNALSLGYFLSEKKISPSTVKKVWREKEALTPQRARILASGFKRYWYLPRKISYAFSLLLILVVAIFFGWGHVQFLFQAQNPVKPVVRSAVKSAVTASPSENARRLADGSVPVPARPEDMDTVSNVPPISASPSVIASSKVGSGIRVKAVVTVKKGTNLSSLAYKFYNEADKTYIDHIMKLNPEIRDPDLILIDQKIKIPEIGGSLLIMQYDGGLYQVHLRTFTSFKIAGQYVRDMPRRGKRIEIIPWKVSPKETWYRVVARPFATRDEGLKFIGQMK